MTQLIKLITVILEIITAQIIRQIVEMTETAEIIHHKEIIQIVSNRKMTVENKKERGLNHKRKN